MSCGKGRGEWRLIWGVSIPTVFFISLSQMWMAERRIQIGGRLMLPAGA